MPVTDLEVLPFYKNESAVTASHDASGSKLQTAFRFTHLPNEIQTQIVAWLLRSADLAKVCLVSRQLYDVAMPMLYHSIYLNVDRWSAEHLRRVLTPQHPGLKHIRALDVDSIQLKSEKLALKVAKDALQVLPRDRLQCFRCPLETGIDDDLIILLAATQRKVGFIALGALLPGALSNILPCLQPWPLSIDTLVIPWKLFSTQDVAFYQQTIARCSRNLKALTVRAHDFSHSSTIVPFLDNQGSERLAQGLFKHLISLPGQPKQVLHDLNLQNQNLEHSEKTLVKFIDFARLRTLQLWNCDNADTLLSCLISLAETEQLRLHGLVLSFEEKYQWPTRAQDFLAATSGLRYLNLDCVPEREDQTRFDIKCLQGHSNSIKDLLLGIGSNCGDFPPLYTPSVDDITWLTANCVKLRQLAIALPPLRLDDALAGQWDEYGEVLTKLATLPALKVLRILTWPQMRSSVTRGRLPDMRDRIAYLNGLDVVAESVARLFQRLRGEHQQRLSVITFGNAEYVHYISRADGGQLEMFKGEPVTYKIMRESGKFGFRTKVKRMDPHLMEHIEPIAYVVDEDTDQGLSLEAYSWGTVN